MEDNSGCIGEKLAPFNPSSDAVIRMAIEMLQLVKESILYDLGCGDGRLLVEAIKASGARGVGVEYDKRFVDRALTRVADAQLEHKIKVVHGNVLDVDIVEATAVFIYLVPAGMAALKEALVSALRAGARVVTYVFSIPGLDPVRVETFKATKIYLYTAASVATPA
ncbi:conserved unknown protein [Ectocarpus siliculosus]|uniref:Methyltransferase domain-containing protein n=1 Tax=Ectocarpus siliculosus TaxID=2880 RepID=D7FNN4_ECTSI|nr:conserved unknown protein [Ectocarpus siliculosus]|eukprot:CBJ26045.1 conserved unknown protein [Ectocarpus siliculosus]